MQIIFENASKLYITINMPIRIGEENWI
jgi:hypothetical protein